MMGHSRSDQTQMPIAPGSPSPKPSGKLNRVSRFRYYIHDGVAECRLQLLGELAEADIGDLNGCWRTAQTILAARPLILDLRGLQSVDEAGKQWLAGMAQEGAICVPESYLRDLVAGRHITGSEVPPARKKLGVLARLVNLFRSPGVEGAK